MHKKILVPVDGSEKSFKTLDCANLLVEKLGGKLIVLHVIQQMENVQGIESSFVDDINKGRQAFSNYIMTRVKNHLGAVILARTEFMHIEASSTSEAIVKVAKEKECDAIIIGARGLDDTETTTMGSVSTAVLNKTNLSVLVVK